jgi:hypothetical protein
MAISINWSTKVISVPQSYLTALGGSRYQLDVDQFRKDLKDIEDSEEGMAFPVTHRHNTAATLSGVTYARQVEIINGYTVEFEAGTYQVECVGANHNIADVKVVNNVSLVIGNSAGLIQVATGAGATPADIWSRVIEGGLTAEQLLRVMLAALAGRTAGVGSAAEQYLSLDGATARIAATFDSQGNRATVAVDGN